MLTNVPVPLPDECLQSYGFRLFQTNQREITTLRSLAKHSCEASGKSIFQLLRHHGPYNYMHFIGELSHDFEGRFKSEIYIYWWVSSCTAFGKAAKYCPKCAQEDVDSHGISYWHRIHLLPGVNHCIRHASPLIVVDYRCLTTCQPAQAERISSQRNAVSPGELDAYMSSKVVHRFTLLSEMILNRAIHLPSASATSTFRKRFNEQRQGSLDDFMSRCVRDLPRGWMSQLLVGKIDKSTISQSVREHFNPYNKRYTTQIYLLLMAMLWDCPDEALNECIADLKLNGSKKTVVMSKALRNDIVTWGAALDGVCV